MSFLPGPDLLLILGRSARSGIRHGFVTVLGLSGGILLHGVLAVFGLTSLLLASSAAFSVVKYAGAVYLGYLGIRLLLSRATIVEQAVPDISLHGAFWQGFLTDALNPKMALWFFAILPQFISPARGNVTSQFIVLLVIQLAAVLPVSFVMAASAGSLSNGSGVTLVFNNGKSAFSVLS